MHTNITKLFIIYIITIIFTVMHLVTSDFFLNKNIALPLFELMIIYYFTIHKNNIFGLWFIILIGLWSDAISGSPLGFTSLIYIVIIKIYHIINQKISTKESFAETLIEFIIFLTIILTLKWLFLSIYYNNLYNFIPFLSQIIISSITYILMHRFFNFLDRNIDAKT